MGKTNRTPDSITVQARDCEEFVLVPRRFLKSLREEIDGLRAQLGLPARQWEPAPAADAVGLSLDPPGSTPRDTSLSSSSSDPDPIP